MNFALLVIRLVVGLFLVGHGAQKLFGWFGGHGLAGTGGFFENLGYRPGRPMAFFAGLGEAGGGALLALGLLTPLATVAVLGVMTNAIASVHVGKGPWATDGGWELPLTYAAVAAALSFGGPGRFSVDHLAGWTLWGTGWGIGAVAVGLLAAGLVLGMRSVAARRAVEQPA